MNTQTRNRVVLIVIALLFLIPPVAAILLQPEQLGQDPERTVNRGDLVAPTVPLPVDDLALAPDVSTDTLLGHWVLVHPLAGACDATCEAEVTDLRQIHIATGRHQDKVSVLLVGATAPSAAEAQRLADIYEKFVLAGDPQGTVFNALVAANGGGRADTIVTAWHCLELYRDLSRPITFTLPLTREAMADYLGLTLETVSRQISSLKKDGVIKLEDRRMVSVPDYDLLLEETGTEEGTFRI